MNQRLLFFCRSTNGVKVNGESVNEIVSASEAMEAAASVSSGTQKKVTIASYEKSSSDKSDLKKEMLRHKPSFTTEDDNDEEEEDDSSKENRKQTNNSGNGVPVLKKLGKKIRLRRKKDKIKTENRAKKALRTISFILGAFVTCWTPYHIIAILASFKPAWVNIHLYMISYFLCYLNSPVNPFCYAAANQQFKNAFKRIMTGDLSLK